MSEVEWEGGSDLSKRRIKLMGSALFCSEAPAAIGTNCASSHCCMVVQNSTDRRKSSSSIAGSEGGPGFLQQSKFYNMVAAPEKCLSGICIVAVLETDTRTQEPVPTELPPLQGTKLTLVIDDHYHHFHHWWKVTCFLLSMFQGFKSAVLPFKRFPWLPWCRSSGW